MIAAKYEEIYPPEVRDYVYICDNAYTRDQVPPPSPTLHRHNTAHQLADACCGRLCWPLNQALTLCARQILDMEKLILQRLDFRLSLPTVWSWMKRSAPAPRLLLSPPSTRRVRAVGGGEAGRRGVFPAGVVCGGGGHDRPPRQEDAPVPPLPPRRRRRPHRSPGPPPAASHLASRSLLRLLLPIPAPAPALREVVWCGRRAGRRSWSTTPTTPRPTWYLPRPRCSRRGARKPDRVCVWAGGVHGGPEGAGGARGDGGQVQGGAQEVRAPQVQGGRHSPGPRRPRLTPPSLTGDHRSSLYCTSAMSQYARPRRTVPDSQAAGFASPRDSNEALLNYSGSPLLART
eukprot:3509400-Rhodomonas_salina.2